MAHVLLRIWENDVVQIIIYEIVNGSKKYLAHMYNTDISNIGIFMNKVTLKSGV